MGQVVQMDAFRKRRNKAGYDRIAELEKAVMYWDSVLRTSPHVRTREQAAIRGMEVKMEIAGIKKHMGVS